MTKPDDRELEQYLEGGSKLSRRYRDASSERAPPELDEAILARSRAELTRKPPSLNRMLAPFALAASVLLGVNLAWNLWQVEPVPTDLRQASKVEPQARDQAFAPEPPPAAAPAAPAPAAEAPTTMQQPERKAKADAETDALRERQVEAEVAQKREDDALRKQSVQEQRAMSARRAEAAPSQSFAAESAGGLASPAPQAMADAAPPSEGQKIDRLIAYVGNLQGAVFIRNGKEHGPADAAKHMQLKREKAGDRCATADAFIRVCASFSSRSGEAYLIRLADGRTRTAEDVLREELARLEGR